MPGLIFVKWCLACVSERAIWGSSRWSGLYQDSPRGRTSGLARGAHNTLALFTMLIGAHVKHKFMLKAQMLSNSRMRYGADRSYLPVPDDQTARRTIMLISIFDVLSAAFFLPRLLVSSRVCRPIISFLLHLCSVFSSKALEGLTFMLWELKFRKIWKRWIVREKRARGFLLQ